MNSTVILTTYADTDENEKEFEISKDTLNKLIKEQGWESQKEFLDNYTYDSSEVIYYRAKGIGGILSEKII